MRLNSSSGVRCEGRRPNAARDDEVDDRAGRFLSCSASLKILSGAASKARESPCALMRRARRSGSSSGAELGGDAGARDGDHADGDAGAIAETVALGRLDGVSDAVAEIQQLADARLTLVLNNDGTLDVDVACDEPANACEVLLEQVEGEGRLLKLGEQLGICDEACLITLSAADRRTARRRGCLGSRRRR